MTIDFSKNYPPFSGVGSLEESKLLENIRDIMFSQYPEVKRLFFTADGGQYESGHMYISKDEPYAER